MKTLFLPNWIVHRLNADSPLIRGGANMVKDSPYWFFKYWRDTEVTVVDCHAGSILTRFQKNILKFYFMQALRVIPHLKDYDLVISHGGQSGFPLAFLCSIFKIKSPPHILIDVSNLTGRKQNSRFWKKLVSIALAKIDAIVYHSTFQEKNYESYGINKEKLFFIPLGVYAEFFKPDKGTDKSGYILSFGYKWRDYATLLEAFSEIKDASINLKIIGAEGMKLPPIPERCEILPVVPIDKLKEFISAARFVVLPIERLPYSSGQLSLLQTMSMGKAVIVTNVPSISDYVTDGHDSLLTGYADAEELREKMEYLLKNPDESVRLGKNARKTIEEKYNEQAMGIALYDVAEKLLQRR